MVQIWRVYHSHGTGFQKFCRCHGREVANVGQHVYDRYQGNTDDVGSGKISGIIDINKIYEESKEKIRNENTCADI